MLTSAQIKAFCKKKLHLRGARLLTKGLLLLTTGFCGGFTTFSAFASKSLAMLQGGHYQNFALYIVLSIALGIAAVFCGYALSKIGF